MSKHFRLHTDEEGVAWLHFAMADSPVNILSTETLAELGRELHKLEEQLPRALVIRSDKAGGFIAGADVKAFAGQDDPAEVEGLIREVHKLFHRIETLSVPTLAMIHGHCLGGGLELALACDYRVASDDPATRIGFPEVLLGIFPGFGGSVRALRILGDIKAMTLMLGGRTLSGRAAGKLGLVDLAVPPRQLENAVRQQLVNRPKPRIARTLARVPSWAPLRPLVAAYLHHEAGKRAPKLHYPAPHALIDHWAAHGRNEPALFESEAKQVGRLLTGCTSQNLIRCFLLQEQLKGLGGKGDRIDHVHVIGAGVMGGDIAAWCALRGCRVSLQDQNLEQLGRAIARAGELFKKKLKDRYATRAAMDRLLPDPYGDGVAKADLVIEAIVEDAAIKQGLFAAVEPRMKNGATLATNTSSIPLQVLAEPLARPERLVGLHFFNPVARMQLVEVVQHPALSDAVMQQALAFVKQISKLPLPVQSAPGFLVNRVLMPYLMEAVVLLQEGVPVQAIDRAAVNFGMPMGPIELADTVGLDICRSVATELAGLLHTPVPAVLNERVAMGRLGRKSGQGFYRWRKGKPIKPDLPRGYKPSAELADRMILRLVNEAMACLREGVVESADLLDAGVIFGTGFAPFRGGPMHYVQQQGKAELQQRLLQLEQQHGSQFRADEGWATPSIG